MSSDGSKTQLALDFTSFINERLAEVRSLIHVDAGLGPQRMRGVIELLERIVICTRDGECSHAHVDYLASGIQGRRAYSLRQVQRWRRWAEQIGVLEVDDRSKVYGGHQTNRWQIRRENLLALIRPAGGVGGDLGVTWGRLKVTPGGDGKSPRGVTGSHPFLNALGLCQEIHSGPVPERTGTGRGVTSEPSGEVPGGSQRDNRTNGSPGPGIVAVSDGTTAPADPPDHDTLRSELIEDHPLLREASERRVASLPPGGLVGDAYAPLQDRHLADGSLVRWFRQQLGLRWPVTPDTEADLLLVLAAGLRAMKLAPGEVRKSRTAAFVHWVSRRQWRTVCPRLPAARRQLDALLERFPQALTHPVDYGPQAARVE